MNGTYGEEFKGNKNDNVMFDLWEWERDNYFENKIIYKEK